MPERDTGKVKTSVVGTRRTITSQKQICETAAPGGELNTDALKSYYGLDEYTHKVVDHAEQYVYGTCTRTAWRIAELPEAGHW
ncbi:MAG TPA: hypothetical protein VGN17_21410 [Bryobacteraceae bacterium]